MRIYLLQLMFVPSVGETDPRTPMGLADRAPFGSAGGGGRTKSRSRRGTRAVYTALELSGEITLLLLLVWFYSVLALERERSVFLGSELVELREPVEPNPLYVAHGPPFIR